MLVDRHKPSELGICGQDIVQVHVFDGGHRAFAEHNHHVQVLVTGARNLDKDARATNPAATVEHGDRINVALRVNQNALSLR